MWRLPAVRIMLLEVAGLAATEDAAAALARAARRSTLVAALDGLALAILFFWRDDGRGFLAFGAAEETLFTLGVVAVAVHAGFRLGQGEKCRAVARALAELDERAG